jgi:glycosyltransferase involved in cell wall biosynthesis
VNLDRDGLSILLWSGRYGGAETWSLALALALHRAKARVGLVIVGEGGPIREQAMEQGLRVETLEMRRGSAVLLKPRELARTASRVGGQVAITPSGGYLSAALRLGGYRGKIIAVEHGALLQRGSLWRPQRWVRAIDWISGLWAVDAQVAPSEYMKDALLSQPHGRIVCRIYHGLDLGRNEVREYAPPTAEGIVVGVAGRLIRGKGFDTALRAIECLPRSAVSRLDIAGDGPLRKELEALCARLGLKDRVRFLGWVRDMASFWRSCDVGLVPSNQWIESFGMVAVEAMAAGIPVLAARRGALPEVVLDGVTGSLFEPGDHEELADLLARYATSEDIRLRHGKAARERCRAVFSIEECARQYEELMSSLMASGSPELRAAS